jgi:hypothetical protein
MERFFPATTIINSGILKNSSRLWIRERYVFHFGFTGKVHGGLLYDTILTGGAMGGSDQSHSRLELKGRGLLRRSLLAP